MKRLIITLFTLCSVLTPSIASAFDYKVLKYDAGGYLGVHLFDSTQDLYNGSTSKARDFGDVPGHMAMFGGYFDVIYKKFAVEASLGFIPTTLENSGDYVTVLNMGVALMYRFEKVVPKVIPYVKIEGGFLGMIADAQGTDFDSILGGGGGVIYPISKKLSVRLDLSYYATDSYEKTMANNFEARLFLGYTWGGIDDMDHDGILNENDKCPYKPEDMDGFEDSDGCPDNDNDNDGVVDSKDQCPGTDKDLADNFKKTKEDKDNFEDKDGCPDPDNDTDGVPDVKDKCPATDPDKLNSFKDVREDKDGFEDSDGCPDVDNDGDSIPDTLDQCPGKDANKKTGMSLMKEDVDGFEDSDGCPDLDNDTDGIPDAQDKCPGKDSDKADNFAKTKETINGVTDEDGCPDEGGKKVVIVLETQVKTLEKIHFELNKAVIKSQSYTLLNQVALTIKSRPDIKVVEIQGHSGSLGSKAHNIELSKKRAIAVRAYLIKRGVSSKRLTTKYYGFSRPIKNCKKIRSRRRRVRCEAINRRVEFHIIKKSH